MAKSSCNGRKYFTVYFIEKHILMNATVWETIKKYVEILQKLTTSQSSLILTTPHCSGSSQTS